MLNIMQTRLMVLIRRYGFFYNTETDYLLLNCIITPRGYLIIYTKESQLKGHAVKLSTAKKIQLISRQKEKVSYFLK